MKAAGMALNVGLCNNIGKCKVKKSQLRGLGLWRRPALKSQKYGKPTPALQSGSACRDVISQR